MRNALTANVVAAAATFVVIGGLAGCATKPSVATNVAAAAVALTEADNAYVAVCKGSPTIKICVDPTKQVIKNLEQKAYNAVKAAEANGALLSLAVDAIADFTAATAAK